MSRTTVFEWHKRFSDGREEVVDNARPGRPMSMGTSEIVSKINQIVRKGRRLSTRMIAEMVNSNKETVRQILHDELNMTKVSAKLVPKILRRNRKTGRQTGHCA